jgi:hypothetical protein
MPEYDSESKFFKDVVFAASPGGHESDSLRQCVNKTVGYMESKDMSQGGYLLPSPLSNTILGWTIPVL